MLSLLVVWTLYGCCVLAILTVPTPVLVHWLMGNVVITPIVARMWAGAVSFLMAFAVSVFLLIQRCRG